MNEVTLLEGISTKPLPAKTFYGPVQVYHAAEVDAYRAKVRSLVEAGKEVFRISNRDHIAWHELKAALAALKNEETVE